MNSTIFRRVGIIINYSALITVLFIYVFGKQDGWWGFNFNDRLTYILGFVIIVTFYFVNMKSGFFKLTHFKKNLDERENQIVGNALRRSYFIFAGTMFWFYTIFSLLANHSNAVLIDYEYIMSRNGDLILIVFYLFLSIPSSILAWHEKEVVK